MPYIRGGNNLSYKLADAESGKLRGALTRDEAILIATDNIITPAAIADVLYLENTNGHHEYRERPVPAWAVRFSDPECTVYISAERGTFEAIRHDQWRAFDFLWMFHTMDYDSRDDFNNWLLRIFSVLGLATTISGFALFFTSTRRFAQPGIRIQLPEFPGPSELSTLSINLFSPPGNPLPECYVLWKILETIRKTHHVCCY